MSAKNQDSGGIKATGGDRDPDAASFPRKTNKRQHEFTQGQKTMMKGIITTSVVLLGLSVVLGYADTLSDRAADAELPPQSVVSILFRWLISATSPLTLRYVTQLVDPKSFAVLPENFTFRTDSFNQHFNPTNAQTPIFQIFDKAFLNIIGTSPSITEIASNSSFAFAHEAPVYISETDEVFFASNDGGPLGMSDLNHNNEVFKISLTEAEQMMKGNEGKAVNVPITPVYSIPYLEMAHTEFRVLDPIAGQYTNDKWWYRSIQKQYHPHKLGSWTPSAFNRTR